jgi:hypothetical protein
MKTSLYTLLPSTVHGTQSENYDGIATEFTGIPFKAAAYYTKNKNLQTVAWFLDNLEATVYIEATLDEDPNSANYSEIMTLTGTLGAELTENDWVNIDGNFTWIRARVVDFNAGQIIKVSLSY